MTHFVYDPPKGDYWSWYPSPNDWAILRSMYGTAAATESNSPENYYFWLGKDGEVDARG